MTTDTSKLSFSNVINGSLRSGSETSYGTDPRTGESSWAVPVASREDLTEAVKAAGNAFQAWSRTGIKERQQVLLKMADLLMAKKEIMSSIVSQETGKSKFMSDLEVEHSANFLQFNASQSLPDDIVHEDTEMKIVSTHTPLGIVGAICPWNFPLVLAAGKIAASLLMGNCVIVKPSPFTPYSVLKFAELAIGTVSAGVFQALNGNNQLGEWMTAHPQIDKISFTGSTGTGRKIMESCSKTLKRITLELGGNDATIVLPDVSVERVAPQVAAGCFFNAGQMCVATKRVYVHEGIYEEFKRTFVEEVQALWRGRHKDNSIIGPLQNSMQYSVVRNLIQDSEAKGYIVALGGSEMAPTGAGAGFFVAPTVLDNPPDSSSVVREEQFGPVIPLLSWKTVDEVVTRANDTVAGLGACVWAEDIQEAERIGRRLEAGSLWLNSYEKPLPMGYFSGHKQSGIGGEWGKQGLLAYCNTQSIHIYKSH